MILMYCEYCEKECLTFDCMKGTGLCGACYVEGKHLQDV